MRALRSPLALRRHCPQPPLDFRPSLARLPALAANHLSHDASSSMEICQLLRETRLKDVVAPRRIHSVSTNTPIAAALQSLCDHRVLSAPVFVAPADRLPTEDLRGSDVDAVPPIVKGLVGVVDVGDVLSELLTRIPVDAQVEPPSASAAAARGGGGGGADTGTAPAATAPPQQIGGRRAPLLSGQDLEEAGRALCAASVGSLFGEGLGGGASARLATSDTAHGRDFGLKGNINNNLMNAIRHGFLSTQYALDRPPAALARHIVHRLAIFDAVGGGGGGEAAAQQQQDGEAELIGLLSQSDVVRFIHRHAHALGWLGSKPLRELLRGHLLPEAPLGSAAEALDARNKMPQELEGGAAGGIAAPPAGPTEPAGAAGGGGGGGGGGTSAQLAPHLQAAPPTLTAGRSHHLVCCPEDVSTLQAFRLMASQQVSGVAVVGSAAVGGPDRAGRLVGNLSASDLRCLAPGMFWTLALPVRDFLAQAPLMSRLRHQHHQQQAQAQAAAAGGVAGEAPGEATGRAMALGQAVMASLGAAAAAGGGTLAEQQRGAVAAAEPPRPLALSRDTDTFGDAVSVLGKFGVHRVYVVDAGGYPVSVVTNTDVLRIISDAC